ncbi:hydrogenase maturation nickel metallochaperone HypA [Campylobacter lanienae]|uniref:hydrogenase maturation nickel metallochaperone HypA n=1 Tax=Campylobacter lanienae TaxID=75658 RepID=UPI000BB4465F|nr:hydrogenase maturation nickel metallochaperone HypA [Campylobacter lanienae]
MHELAIVQELFKLCETNAMKHKATRITKVEIEVGRLSGVEAHYLQSAFDAFKTDTICSQAKLIIHPKDITIQCNECGAQSILLENEFLCPKCGSNSLEVISGEDMYLMRLEMD